MIEMFTREQADKIDGYLNGCLEDSRNYFLVPNSEWRQMFQGYVEDVQKWVEKNYTSRPPEDVNERNVHEGMKRKLEWVFMHHRVRYHRPYPLLTKSFLPLLAEALERVKPSVLEVSPLL